MLAPVARMEARGLTRAMLASGKPVTLIGYPRRDGTAEMRIETGPGRRQDGRAALNDVNAAFARFAEAMATSSFGQWASGSALAYPVANVVHLLGLVMLIGAIGIVDLRLAGAFRTIPVAPLYRSLIPVAIAGLILMVPSGATMFAADAISMAGSAVFRWKITLGRGCARQCGRVPHLVAAPHRSIGMPRRRSRAG